MNKLVLIILSFFIVQAHAVDMDQLKAELKKRVEEHKAKEQEKKQNQNAANELPAAPVCDATISNGICYAFTGPGYADSKASKGNEMACKLLRGKLLPASKCPDARLIGRCKVAGSTPKEYVLHYYANGKMTSGKAQADCSNAKSGLHAQGAGVWM